MKKLIFFWKELLTTFWFLPVSILISSILLAVGSVYLDNTVSISQDGWFRFFVVNSSDSARTILSTISGAMIGVAGTVFSVTLVALTLASSQFGPRLIKKFMYVRLNQVVLGSYISTYLYCLIVLIAIKGNDDYTFIPSISILIAIFAAIVNIILLITFIHQIATSIQADKVVSDISNFISNQVENLFPDRIGDEKETDGKVDSKKILSSYQNQISVKSPKNGYLQYIDGESLMKAVATHDVLFELNYRPGAFLIKGMDIGLIFSNRIVEEKEIDKILSHFVIGETKTAQQDLEFSIHQMVEIASRAISPGINDPFTAIACIDNLTATLSYLVHAKFPSKYRYDSDGNLRIIADTMDFEGVLDASFNQIRQYSGGSPSVIIRLMEALILINGFAKEDSHKKALVRHAKMVFRKGKQTIQEKNDLEDLRSRAEKILSTLQLHIDLK
ncbi:DUF2254 domain-containing protein [Algoriphagus sp. D3-2-R+10]|uniref:DUF2254 domain-containing protein n=1 Tax=Algoriphagus aurantiacus TaxID=3103948 RepID=UPI002B3756D0|nr:DUF2254 domain-containing protein [Algoriphagus sp. D3-2-R+10]MEB2775127.1 DUF2254 domain-containing protein [Algoriphagus sp. D3-2-R+10]